MTAGLQEAKEAKEAEDAAAEAAAAEDDPCADFAGMFMFFEEAMSFDDAEATCGDNNGALTSIHSAEENACIASLLPDDMTMYEYAWLGAKDDVEQGTWVWTDGSERDYANDNDDNNDDRWDCLVMHSNNDGNVLGEWDDDDCTEAHPFVCKINE